MSTIRVTNVQDTAGANSATTAQIYNGIARAWINFNGTTGVNIRSDYNVDTVTDGGTGIADVTFTTAMPDANYAIICSGGHSGGANTVDVYSPSNAVPTTSGFRVGYAYGSSSSPSDIITYVCVAVYST
jgi:hypothetical protein